MKFKEREDLPGTIRKQLPTEAQDVYLNAFNKSWDNFDGDDELGQQGREAVAHRDAWATVKRDYVHNEERGIWYREGEEPEAEETEGGGIVESIKQAF